MSYLNFSEALAEAKRKAALQGREVTQQEAAGLSEGIAETAASNAANLEALAQSEEQFEQSLAEQKSEYQGSLAQSQSQFEATLAENRSQFAENLKIAQQEYELAVETLNAQIEQYESSTALQKEMFEAQMAQQISDSAEAVRQWEAEYETAKSQWESEYELLKKQTDAQIAAANNSNSGGSCTIVSFLFGRDSREHRLTKLFCARFMTRKALIGYYQLAMTAKNFLIRFPVFTPFCRERLGRAFINWISWKLGKKESVPTATKVWGNFIIVACRVRYSFGHLRYFPDGSVKCLEAVDRRMAQEA
jgi:hypothetical protein